MNLLSKRFLYFISLLILVACDQRINASEFGLDQSNADKASSSISIPEPVNTTTHKVIHVFVALCDNKYQGIVPVPPKIGNGQDPPNNLYWGCAYGVKTFFKKRSEWQLISSMPIDSLVLERLIFKHKTQKYYLIADAYNGKEIKQCTIDFLNACAGKFKCQVQSKDNVINGGGQAELIAYVGHDGLMDFTLENNFSAADQQNRKAIMLACISRKYFAPHLKATQAQPILWSNGLMAPEAYVLHAALKAYVSNNGENVAAAAAQAYNQYQKCGTKAANRLLVGTW